LAYPTLAGVLTGRDRDSREVYHFADDKPSNRNRALAFHPKSKELAFAIGSRVWVWNLETAKLKELTEEKPAPGEAGPIEYLALQYAADDRLLGAAQATRQRNKVAFAIRDVAAD